MYLPGHTCIFISFLFLPVYFYDIHVRVYTHTLHTCMFNTTCSTGVPGVHTRVPVPGNSKFVVRDDFKVMHTTSANEVSPMKCHIFVHTYVHIHAPSTCSTLD
jgi:hypothetical protein